MVPFELQLVPVRIFRNPFSLDPHKLVLCEAREMDGTPALGNRRQQCLRVMEASEDHKPWFGFEQEYLLETPEGLPLGWTSPTPPPVVSTVSSAELGLDKVFGRDVCVSHCRACLYAGVRLTGTTAEGLPSQVPPPQRETEGCCLD
uniref:Uncharacterized protein n=1 Tax=Knipowitschia caucasica TaxID=637954 RepID=A0AAV2LPR6_KNICA